MVLTGEEVELGLKRCQAGIITERHHCLSIARLLSNGCDEKCSDTIKNLCSRDDERIKLLELRRRLIQQSVENLISRNLLDEVRLSSSRTLITAEIVA